MVGSPLEWRSALVGVVRPRPLLGRDVASDVVHDAVYPLPDLTLASLLAIISSPPLFFNSARSGDGC